MRMKTTIDKAYLAVKVACVVCGFALVYTTATHYAEKSRAAAYSQAAIRPVSDATSEELAHADTQNTADLNNEHLLDAALQLAAANDLCNLAFSDLNRYKPLGVQKRDDLQDCLWARYATEQAAQGSKPTSRAEWLQKTQLDARAADSQLVAAWQSPRMVRGPQ